MGCGLIVVYIKIYGHSQRNLRVIMFQIGGFRNTIMAIEKEQEP